jgi:bifunctional enzyme CysN/CysC
LLTGLPGSGKTTTAYGVERALFDHGRTAMVLDGQNLRVGLDRDLGFSAEDRSENLRRAAEVAKLVNNAGLICLLAMVSPNEETRLRAGQVIGEGNFMVVHLDAPLELSEQRNVSARRKGAREEIAADYQPPASADLVLNTGKLSAVECVEAVLNLLESKGVIPKM